MADEALVLTVEEAAKLLRIGRTACYEGIRRGDIPAVRIGRTLRVPRRGLHNLLNGNRANRAPDLHEVEQG